MFSKKKIGLAIVLFVALLLYWFLPLKPRHIPFYGQWVSAEPSYHDCYMKITPDVITFGQSGNLVDSYRITDIEAQITGGKQDYTVYYRDESGEMKISFEYRADNGGEIRIKNQEHILWTLLPPIDRS